MTPGRTVSVPLPVAGGVRGVGLTPVTETAAPVDVELADPSGAIVAHGGWRPAPAGPGAPKWTQDWVVPVAAENVPAGTRLTARITVGGTAPVTVAASAGSPALTVVTSTEDGLRLVYAAESVIYERTRVLDRARWASATVVEPDASARLQLLSGGTLRPDQVVLDAPGPAAEGAPAEVTWVEDGLDEMVLSVRAQGAGYLVLADALQTDWKVTVDGVRMTPVHADHAFVAVPVPRGEHTVRWYYPLPWTGPGAWITAVTVLALLVGLGVEEARRRVRA